MLIIKSVYLFVVYLIQLYVIGFRENTEDESQKDGTKERMVQDKDAEHHLELGNIRKYRVKGILLYRANIQ